MKTTVFFYTKKNIFEIQIIHVYRARYLSRTRKSVLLNAHADIASGVRSLKFGLILYIHLYSVWNASNEGFGSPRPSSLDIAISVPHLSTVKPV